MSAVIAQPAGADAAQLALSTLQAAYDANTTPPQIVINATPDPLALMASVTGPVLQVQDTVGANIFEVDDTFVEVDGNLRIVDAFINHGAANSLTITDNFTTGGGFVGGGILSNGAVTYNNSVFIWALLQESKVYNAAVAPGFAAFTLFNALATIQNSGNFNLVQALTLNIGVGHNRITSGTSTTVQNVGVSFSPAIRATVSGAVMTRTLCTALNVAPTFSTVGGATVNLGTISAVNCVQPAVQLFGTQAGVENMTAYYGLNFANMTFGGASAVYSVVRSLLNAGTNKHFLDHTGTARSRMRGNLAFDVDLTGIFFGASDDAFIAWAGGTNSLFVQFSTAFSDQLHFSNPSDARVLLQGGAAGAALNEITFNFARFAFGQVGTVGNQVGIFAAPARTAPVAGGWADFLLTQAGNLNLGVLNMSDVSAWVINAISFDNTAYSISELSTFRVGGMTVSNPGGTVTSRAAFWSTGRFLQRGSVQYVPITPAALASGNNNDWNGLLTATPSNNSRRWARISGDVVTSVITGIDATAVQDGDTFELTNVSANSIDITNQDAASVAANRIITGTGATFALGADRTVTIRYDSTTARWRLLERT